MEYSMNITAACSGTHVDIIMITTTTTTTTTIGATGTISESL
jgi:hypothetical protein